MAPGSRGGISSRSFFHRKGTLSAALGRSEQHDGVVKRRPSPTSPAASKKPRGAPAAQACSSGCVTIPRIAPEPERGSRQIESRRNGPLLGCRDTSVEHASTMTVNQAQSTQALTPEHLRLREANGGIRDLQSRHCCQCLAHNQVTPRALSSYACANQRLKDKAIPAIKTLIRS